MGADDQVVEYVQHLARSLASPSEAAYKELLASFESQIKSDDPNVEVPEDSRKSVVKGLVSKTVELRGALEGVRDTGEPTWTIMGNLD